jgi:eukaryotic-like serine/threonine-protein kinase
MQGSAFGDFRVSHVLGDGGSGTVYAATHAGREVALKVLHEDLALSEKERRRFLDEATRMCRAAHPGLIALLHAGTLPDGRPYLCMPRLVGETLSTRVENGPLPVRIALAHFETLAQAVAALHSRGVIHRDIKPENVFLEDRSDRPVLLDFGIARDVGDSSYGTTDAGKVRGTVAYMAPERFFGVRASATTDVFELGVVFYVMLVGQAPWSRDSGAAGRLRPRDPAEMGVFLPRPLVAVMMRALSWQAEDRPSSADAFAREVRRAVASPRSPQPGSRWRTAGLVGTALVMTMIALLVRVPLANVAARALGFDHFARQFVD